MKYAVITSGTKHNVYAGYSSHAAASVYNNGGFRSGAHLISKS